MRSLTTFTGLGQASAAETTASAVASRYLPMGAAETLLGVFIATGGGATVRPILKLPDGTLAELPYQEFTIPGAGTYAHEFKLFGKLSVGFRVTEIADGASLVLRGAPVLEVY
jgi:hypothetical protein